MGVKGAAVLRPYKEKREERRESLLLGRRRGRGDGGVANGGAIDDELDAAVALAAFGSVIGGDGLRFAEAAGGDGGGRDTLLGEKIADGIGAVFGELLIEIVAADTVRVTFDLESEAGMRENDAGNFGEFFAGAGLEGVAAGVEEHIGHIDDETASGVAGLQNGIQLAEKLGANVGLFGFGLRHR